MKRTFEVTDSRSERDDRGETLLEILIAMVILGITTAAILGAFASAISESARHRSLVVMNTMLRNYAETATSQIQFQKNPLYTACATSYAVTGLATPPSGYSLTLSSITYWNGTVFGTTCSSASAPQLLTVQATGLYGQTANLSFAVSDVAYTAAPVAPAFTSASSTTAATGSPFSFTVATSGSPYPVLTSTALPSGVSFVDNNNGTGTLSGTSSVAGGTYSINFTANNSVGSPATQAFTLVVATPPQITSASSVTWTHGTHVTFTVTATGVPTPALSYGPGTGNSPIVTSLPPGLTFTDNGGGNATITGTLTSTTGTYNITIIANSGSLNATQSFTMTVS